MRKGKNVYKRKDGHWEARVLVGHTAGGQPRYKYLYAHSYRDVLPLQDLGQDDYDRLMAQSRGRLKGSSLDIINTVLKGIVQYSLSDRDTGS